MRIDEAEVAIGQILKQLEVQTGTLVRSVSIEDLDVTSLGDERREVVARVKIEMVSIPGRRW